MLTLCPCQIGPSCGNYRPVIIICRPHTAWESSQSSPCNGGNVTTFPQEKSNTIHHTWPWSIKWQHGVFLCYCGGNRLSHYYCLPVSFTLYTWFLVVSYMDIFFGNVNVWLTNVVKYTLRSHYYDIWLALLLLAKCHWHGTIAAYGVGKLDKKWYPWQHSGPVWDWSLNKSSRLGQWVAMCMAYITNIS